MATVAMLARQHPLAAVRLAERNAGVDEAKFQLARLEAVDLSQETPEQRSMAHVWLRKLRAYCDAPNEAW